MSQVLILAGDTITVRSMLMSLQMEGFTPQRVSNGDELLSAFSRGSPAGVLCDMAAPWSGLSALLRRVRAHGKGKRYRLMLFGNAREAIPEAGLQALGIKEDDLFSDPVDMARLSRRLKDIPIEAPTVTDPAAARLTPQGFPVHGRLEAGTVAGVVARLSEGHGTGQLEVDGTQCGLMTLTFKEGAIVAVAVPTGRLSLGELMISRGRLDRAKLQELSRQGPVTLETLVSHQLISPHESVSTGREQAGEVLRTAVGEAEGSYRWHEGRLPQGSTFPLGLNLFRVVLDYYKEAGPAALPSELVASAPLLDETQRARLQTWGLQPFELRAINQLNGAKTLEFCIEALAAGSLVKKKELTGFFTGLSLLGLFGGSVKAEAVPEEEPDTWEARALKLKAELERMSGGDPFEVLGITPQLPLSEVRSRFFTLSKQYHPDRAYDAPPEVRQLMEEIFRKVGQAYEIASDPRKREDYLRDKDIPTEGGLDPRNAIRAEIAFSQGELALRNQGFAKARTFFEEAVKLNPHAVEHKAYLGWATFLENNERFAEAAKLIHEAIKLSPQLDRGYYFLGCIFKARNEMSQAENAFKKAVSINANNIEAQRELRLMQMRREKGGLTEKPRSGPERPKNPGEKATADNPPRKKSVFDLFKRS